jgi:methylated-DNA-protein-cysteine methyltransferase related protein
VSGAAAGPTRHRGQLSPSDERAREILDRVRAVPEGFVRTYGDISPGAPRLAGTVLSGCEDPTVPWHRIVRADGSLAKGDRQRRLLDREGVPFHGARVDMGIARMVVFGEEPA